MVDVIWFSNSNLLVAGVSLYLNIEFLFVCRWERELRVEYSASGLNIIIIQCYINWNNTYQKGLVYSQIKTPFVVSAAYFNRFPGSLLFELSISSYQEKWIVSVQHTERLN